MKKILMFSILLVFFLSFAGAESLFIEEERDFSQDFGFPNGSFEGLGLEVGTIYSEMGHVIEIHFKYWDSYLLVGEKYRYENINPEIDFPAYILFNENLTSILADFYTQNESRSYRLGNKTIEIPANSRVYYKGKTIEISILDGANMSMYENLLNFILGTPLTKINGKNIYLPNDIYLERGEIEITQDGFLLKNGSINYKKNLMNIDSEWTPPILIAKKGKDMSNYKGTWIRQENNILEVSAGETTFNLEFEPGNEIVNNDEKDKFHLTLGKDNYIKIENREEEDLIPKLTYKVGDEENPFSLIANDHFVLEINKEEFTFHPNTVHTYEFSSSGESYQSLAMEVEFDSEKIDKKININSYRQYTILSKENKELVTLNKYELPVSRKISDNTIQTLNQLREKYPEIDFTLEEVMKTGSRLEDLNHGGYETEDQVPAYLIYLTNTYLSQTPKALENLNTISLSNEDYAYARDQTIGFGNYGVDPQGAFEISGIREMISPLKTLDHEHEHVKDQIIFEEELTYLKTLDNPDLNKLFKVLDQQKKEMNELMEKKEKIIYSEEIYSDLSASEIEKELSEIEKAREEVLTQINKYETSILYHYYNGYEKATLQQEYNKIANKGMKIYLEDEKTLNQIDVSIEDIEKNYLRKEIKKILKESFGEDVSDKKEIDDYQKYILKKFYDWERDPDDPNMINSVLKKELIISKGVENKNGLSVKRALLLAKDLENYKKTQKIKLFGLIKAEEIEPEERYFLLNEIFLTIANFEEIEFHREKFDKILRTSSGIPYHYSLRNYNPGYISPSTASYLEMPSTYQEQPLELRKQRLNSANPNIQKTYTRLTQLAFDSEKMPVEDYKYLMPEGHCQRSDCSDQLCVEYKLLCCIKNPDVPNC